MLGTLPFDGLRAIVRSVMAKVFSCLQNPMPLFRAFICMMKIILRVPVTESVETMSTPSGSSTTSRIIRSLDALVSSSFL